MTTVTLSSIKQMNFPTRRKQDYIRHGKNRPRSPPSQYAYRLATQCWWLVNTLKGLAEI